MRAVLLYGARDVRVEEVPDPQVVHPTDAVVRIVASCVCGSDLWGYRGITPIPNAPRRYGHEFVGVIEDVGDEVRTVRTGDFVVAPFSISDGICAHCRAGVHTSCEHVTFWGGRDETGTLVDGGQGEYARVPWADGTLVKVPGQPDPALIPSLLTLSDVMGTGHHAARLAGVQAGSTVAVVGDGAVGLCAVLAANRLGADRIIAMSRHPQRQALATAFGATDLLEQRGDEGADAVRATLGDLGADCVLECVGTKESMQQAINSARPGGRIGYVGVPAGGPELPVRQIFNRNLTVGGGMAPVRRYLPELLSDVLAGRINPGLVFDLELPLEQAAAAYQAMDARTATKVLLNP